MNVQPPQHAPQYSWPQILSTLKDGDSLSYEQARWTMSEVMSGEAGEARLAALLMGLAIKGETVDEVAGFSDVMRERAEPLKLPAESLDIVGTGGDQLNTVNISTMSVIVASAAGAPVVKHGNRSATSMSGSADVLEALGVRLAAPMERLESTFDQIGLAFVFAQAFHPSMRHAAPARRAIGVPTVFNLLGPLTNPAAPAASAIGAPRQESADLIAGVLARRGSRGLVFRGHDGLDELTVTDASTVLEVRNGEITRQTVTPEEVGLRRWTVADLTGGDAHHNASVVRSVLEGRPGAARDAVLLNAAAGLVAFSSAADGSVVERLTAGIAQAAQAIDSGAAAQRLDRWVQLTSAE
ncbi:anthranilate phosphoribosyltransferase [Falsarthrobacter nasiphocae]|uniref:Anthranilate phosphoribosyltransferase n=1 Tax=Falsarthrobacter nasiphocae TaxID=189863 RepID=A0AAE3YBX2_9MICC|nr:anthranilate phosphoribosyltransferase [Falsarthrobacter nasiphocae]MDR6891093.1 anthranilate phosphoribosyltransferase [Falsarthrobacter nasiphocae]